jgi:hypothetical protein
VSIFLVCKKVAEGGKTALLSHSNALLCAPTKVLVVEKNSMQTKAESGAEYFESLRIFLPR